MTDHSPLIGVVCALHIEVAPFLKRCRQLRTERGNGFTFRGCEREGIRICLVEGGAGVARARQATQALIDAFQPAWILSVGFSGGLIESLRVGDLVVGNSVTDSEGDHALSIDLRMKSSPENGILIGRLCTTNHIVRRVDEKRVLAEKTGAIAVDMESLAVAQVCRERKTKFIPLRVISDDLSSDLPAEILAILGPKGTVRAGALVGSLFKRPSSAKDLWKMREKAVHSAERLADLLEVVISGLKVESTSTPS